MTPRSREPRSSPRPRVPTTRCVERKSTPDPKSAATAAEEIRSSTLEERDELLTDLLCHVYATKAAQNG